MLLLSALGSARFQALLAELPRLLIEPDQAMRFGGLGKPVPFKGKLRVLWRSFVPGFNGHQGFAVCL